MSSLKLNVSLSTFNQLRFSTKTLGAKSLHEIYLLCLKYSQYCDGTSEGVYLMEIKMLTKCLFLKGFMNVFIFDFRSG